jgi:hypothetical protein
MGLARHLTDLSPALTQSHFPAHTQAGDPALLGSGRTAAHRAGERGCRGDSQGEGHSESVADVPEKARPLFAGLAGVRWGPGPGGAGPARN